MLAIQSHLSHPPGHRGRRNRIVDAVFYTRLMPHQHFQARERAYARARLLGCGMPMSTRGTASAGSAI
jgi:hypothetical protein